jgi:hypothetical protein
VKGVSIYKDKLSTYLNEKVLIYVQDKEMKNGKGYVYRQYKRINKKFDSDFIVVLSNHLISAHKKKIQLYQMEGILDREWVFESSVTFIKCVGGMDSHENLLIGLKNGNVLKLNITNSFPIILSNHNNAIVCCDLSLDKRVITKNISYSKKFQNCFF